MSILFAAVAGAIAAAAAFAVIAIVFLCFRRFHRKNSGNRNSDTGSTDPPALGEWNMGGRVSSSGCRYPRDPNEVRQFTLEELDKATRNFAETNLVGNGSFGSVYKGLLCDGTVVAVKRRTGSPKPEFAKEVHYLSKILHRNLVTLIGYCQEGGSQMLVFEYLPNGSLSDHLYDAGQDSKVKLEFKQRLSVAIGAAKGLSHLHSLSPPLIHKKFKTSNVLVDENFIAKVADAGLVILTQKYEEGGPSDTPPRCVFRDPEVGEVGEGCEPSDVYSFGVLLLELVTGQRAAHLAFPDSRTGLVEWVEEHPNSDDLADCRLAGSYTSEGMAALIRLTLLCLSSPGTWRPTMAAVVAELDRILETEMTLTTVMGDGTAIVTLGSQLFTSA